MAKRPSSATKSSAKRPAPPESNQTRIVNAAIACFERYGPAKTTMEDIADAAGLDRKTLYRVFSNRTKLLDTIAILRLGNAADSIRRVVDSCKTLDEAIIKGSYQSIRLLSRDKIFMSVVENANDRGVEQYLIDPSSPVLKLTLSIWKETFARARLRGELRKDLTDAEIANWLRGVHLLFMIREDFSPKVQEDMLRKFVLPALKRD